MGRGRARSVALGAAVALLMVIVGPACGTGAEARSAPGDLTVDVVFGLQRDQQGLADLALAVNDPASPDYGAFLSADDVARRFGAPPEAVAQVTDLLEERGAVVSAGPAGGFVSASMTVDAARELLGVGFDVVGVPGDRQVLRPTAAPRAPGEIGAVVAEVVGLTELVPAEVRPPRPPEASTLVPPAGQCAATTQQIEAVRDRYGFTRSRSAGAAPPLSVAVLAAERFDESERVGLSLLTDCLGLPPVEPFLVDAAPGRTVDGFSEIDLDVQTLVALLPGQGALHLVEMDPYDWVGAALAASLDASRTGGALVDAITTSIDFCEGDMTDPEVRLAEYVLGAAAVMGVTVVAAAGDSGSSGCHPPRQEMYAQYPASSWFATGVGGTQLPAGPPSGDRAGRVGLVGSGRHPGRRGRPQPLPGPAPLPARGVDPGGQGDPRPGAAGCARRRAGPALLRPRGDVPLGEDGRHQLQLAGGDRRPPGGPGSRRSQGGGRAGALEPPALRDLRREHPCRGRRRRGDQRPVRRGVLRGGPRLRRGLRPRSPRLRGPDGTRPLNGPRLPATLRRRPEGNAVRGDQGDVMGRGWRMRGAVVAATALAVLAVACGPTSEETVDDVGRARDNVASASGMTVTIVNDTGRPDSSVYVMLIGNGAKVSDLVVDQAKPLSSLPSGGKPHAFQFGLDSVGAGRVYVSFDEPLKATPAPSPDVSPVRFDWIELTYPGGGNLTAVDMFGIPMSLRTYSRSDPGRELGSRTYTCYTDVVVQNLASAGVDLSKATRHTPKGDFARVVSPNITPAAFPDFQAYVRSMSGQAISISGEYVGPHGPHGQFHYTGTFQADGSITMNGMVPSGKGEALAVSGSTLPHAIYSANGPYSKGGKAGQVGDNDVYSAIYRDLVAAFAWGYWGSTYGSDNSAFDGKPAFSHARSSKPAFAAYNTYAAALYEYSDTYGFPFSDTYGNPKNPFIDMSGDVGRLEMTLHPDKSPSSCPSAPWPPSH